MITLLVGLLGLAGLPARPATAATDSSRDYASMVLGNPWDMSGPEDIAFERTRDQGNVRNLSFSGGVLSATPTNNDPRLILRWPVDPNTNAVPQDGNYQPINADTYRFFTVRVFVSGSQFAQVFWLPAFGGSFGGTGFKTLQNGWNTVTFDLKAEHTLGPDWTGQIQGLMFDPEASTAAFQIDYIRLSSAVPANPDNTPPQLVITAPSFISGPDYATEVVGNPWDMSDAADITRFGNLTGQNFSGGVFSASSVSGNDDPSVHLHVTSPIDSARYHYATYRMQLDGQQDTTLGSVARWIWWSDIPENASVSLSFVVYEGFQNVGFDLNTLRREPANARTWQQGRPIVFRFDPHEFSTPHSFHLDYVMLTGDNYANQSYNIRYQAADADGSTPTPHFYYYPAGNPGARQAIACQAQAQVQATDHSVYLPIVTRLGPTPPVQVSGDTCRWNTASVPNGTYYIYGEVDDGTDVGAMTSQTPVIVSH